MSKSKTVYWEEYTGSKTKIEIQHQSGTKAKKDKSTSEKILKNIITKRLRPTSYNLKESLFQRDGNLCFYSGRPMTKETATIEHLVPKSKGGANCKENLVLCLKEFNQIVCDWSLSDKLKYKESLWKEVGDE